VAGRKPANPPRARQGFVTRDRVRCPACEDREALRNDGGAKVIRGGQLNGATVDVGITTASAGCEVCKPFGSRGWIEPTDQEARDPYSLPLTPEQAARMRTRRK